MQKKVETILWNLRWKVLEGLINDEEGDSGYCFNCNYIGSGSYF